MVQRSKYRVNQSVLPHTFLWAGAQVIEVTAGNQVGSEFHRLTALLYRYLAFEGYLNWVGPIVCPAAWRDERRFFASGRYAGTLGKFRLLIKEFRVTMPANKRPYSTIVRVAALRDQLVHPRPQASARIVRARSKPALPLAWHIGQLATKELCERARTDIWDACEVIHVAGKERLTREAVYCNSAFGLFGWQQAINLSSVAWGK